MFDRQMLGLFFVVSSMLHGGLSISADFLTVASSTGEQYQCAFPMHGEQHFRRLLKDDDKFKPLTTSCHLSLSLELLGTCITFSNSRLKVIEVGL